MSVSDIATQLLEDWFSQYTLIDGQTSAVVPIVKLNDSDKAVNILAYLQARIASNQNEINALPQYVIDQTARLNADIAACNSAITDLNK